MPYGHKRAVDQERVPLLRRDGLGFTTDLSPEQITEYFEFRTRLTFAVLSARRFFTHRYSNSDNTRLVIQEFTPARAGGAVLEHRRRDGSVRILVPAGNLSVPRPHHVSGWCALPGDIDTGLLRALEAAVEGGAESWPRIAEAIRLFVGANTDAPGVDMHSELIDVVSAFSRVADCWDEKGTVGGFTSRLRVPGGALPGQPGPKASEERVQRGLKKRESVRGMWLKDAYVLRSQFGHGRVEQPQYRATWTEREHLLLAAVAFPLYVKAVLADEGLYQMTEADEMVNGAFDDLALLAPFAEGENEATVPWNETMSRAQIRRLTERYLHELEAVGSDEEGQAGGET
jgi:hypothetical protein